MEKIIVIGGSGFIGQAIQQCVLGQKKKNSFVFSYYLHPEKINDNLEKIQINLLQPNTIKLVKDYPIALYVAGSGDHRLASISPSLDLELNVKTFLNFLEQFKGNLVLLSSQAVYYGLKGEISEDVKHLPTVPYGLSKKAIEAYAEYFFMKRKLSKLWILRLMYAFGEGEKEQRLIPRCARAALTGEKVIIFGKGNSLLNPLPSSFVAEILIKAIEHIKNEEDGFFEVTNLNYPRKVRVIDVVRFLQSIKNFNYTISKKREEMPIEFYGSIKKICTYMKKWNVQFPDLGINLKRYFTKLTKGT
uniref:NAD(P)-dependent oxidoreductase n=1 Tax=candidate division WOR-3 bacterium TaxID=2052148 RepID=A0A7C2K6E6_UNCW3